MPLNAVHLREYIVVPTLLRLHPEIPFSAGAVELVMGTAAQESGLRHLDQLAPGPGPAYGLWQMEADTHNDLWDSWILPRPHVTATLYEMLGKWPSRIAQLRSNLSYGAAMCRILYRRTPTPIPEPGDIEGQAAMWKRWYNTPLGRGTPAQYVRSYAMVRDGALTIDLVEA